MLLLQQIQTAVPGWVGPTMAISLAIMAISFFALALMVGLAARSVARQAEALTRALTQLKADLGPALSGIREITDQGRELTTMVKEEATAMVGTSRRLRERVEDGADRLQERLEDLEALYDVMEEEVQETALDFATALRTIRTGGGWFRRLKRLVRGRRR